MRADVEIVVNDVGDLVVFDRTRMDPQHPLDLRQGQVYRYASWPELFAACGSLLVEARVSVEHCEVWR